MSRCSRRLSRRLFDAGVLPYYLHALDPVRGAAHFAVPDERAQALAGQLAARLPGYLVPRLVREVAGAPAKVALRRHILRRSDNRAAARAAVLEFSPGSPPRHRRPVRRAP